MSNVETNTMSKEGTSFISQKKDTLILPKSNLKVISSKCLSF